jgi:hypothetical protein
MIEDLNFSARERFGHIGEGAPRIRRQLILVLTARTALNPLWKGWIALIFDEFEAEKVSFPAQLSVKYCFSPRGGGTRSLPAFRRLRKPQSYKETFSSDVDPCHPASSRHDHQAQQ